MNKLIFHKLILFIRIYAKVVLFLTWLLYGFATIYLAAKAHLFKSHIDWIHTFVNGSSTDIKAPSDFVISFSASMIDTFAFFSLIGIITFIISLKPPEEEDFKRKLHIMFPDAKGDNELTTFLLKSIGQVACVCKKSTKSFVLKDLTDCNKYMKVVMKVDSKLQTIHYNETWVTEDSKFRLKVSHPPSDVEVIGAVADLDVYRLENGNVEPIYKINDIIELTKEHDQFDDSFPMSVSPSGTIVYKTSTWMWQNLEKDTLNISYSRFSHEELYEYENETEHNIKLIIHYKGKNDLHIESDSIKKEHIIARLTRKITSERKKVEESLGKGDKEEPIFEEIEVPSKGEISFTLRNLTPDDKIEIKYEVIPPEANN